MNTLHKTELGTLGAFRCWKGTANGITDRGVAIGCVEGESGEKHISPVARLVESDGKLLLVIDEKEARRLNIEIIQK